MKPSKISWAILVFGLLQFTAKAQDLVGNEYVNFSLACQAPETNFEINTKSLVRLIAADQGFTPPSNARLWLFGGPTGLLLLRQPNGNSTIVDTNIFNIAFVTNILSYQLTQNTNTYLETAFAPTVLELNYNGASVSFTLTCAGDWKFYNHVNFHKSRDNAIVITSFSGTCVGYGTYGGQTMVIKGTMKGNYTFRYAADDGGGGGGDGGGVGAFPQ